jgi:hypothetical protein
MAKTWAGTQREFQRLRDAVLRNCTCQEPTLKNPSPRKCETCRMLTDQDALNRMGFVAARRADFLHGEFDQPRVAACRLCGQFHMDT